MTPIAPRGFALLLASLLAAASAAAAQPKAEPPPEPAPDPVGISLGEFFYRDVRVAEGAKVRIHFSLHASAPADRAEQLRSGLARSEHRVRDAVMTALRMTPLDEFQEPELSRVKRRIQARLRWSMPELAIDGLYLSEFGFFGE